MVVLAVFTYLQQIIHLDLKTFRDFLYRNFKDHLKHEKMLLTSNQPEQLHGTAKLLHKLASTHTIQLK